MFKVFYVSILVTFSISCHVHNILAAALYNNNLCTKIGYFTIEENKQNFYGCFSTNNNVYKLKKFSCLHGQVFDATVSSCVSLVVPFAASSINNRVIISDADDNNVTTDELTTNESTIDGSITDESTTVDSTTDESTTNESTIADSTTDESTTDGSTTVESTTVDSTTDESTTVEYTTVDSTTDESTTVESTTVGSTTDESTTVESTTEVSTTDESTADISTTEESTAEVTSTVVTTTEESSTVETTTELLTTTTNESTTDETITTETSTDLSTTITTPTTDESTSIITTTIAPNDTTSTETPPHIVCAATGFFPENNSCTGYVYCVVIDGKLIDLHYSCPNGMQYNPQVGYCEEHYNCFDGERKVRAAAKEQFQCKKHGTASYAADASKYYYCWWDKQRQVYESVIMNCSRDTTYDSVYGKCL